VNERTSKHFKIFAGVYIPEFCFQPTTPDRVLLSIKMLACIYLAARFEWVGNPVRGRHLLNATKCKQAFARFAPEHQRLKHFPARAGLSVTWELWCHKLIIMH